MTTTNRRAGIAPATSAAPNSVAVATVQRRPTVFDVLGGEKAAAVDVLACQPVVPYARHRQGISPGNSVSLQIVPAERGVPHVDTRTRTTRDTGTASTASLATTSSIPRPLASLEQVLVPRQPAGPEQLPRGNPGDDRRQPPAGARRSRAAGLPPTTAQEIPGFSRGRCAAARNVESTRSPGSAPIMVAPPNGPLDRLLGEIHGRYRTTRVGEVASYIPELAKADPSLFGLALTTMDGFVHAAGASGTPFSIQSVSKPFVYALALADRGFDEVASRVGVEPTGDAFNAITLEPQTGRPLNPMVNAGAILTASLVAGSDEASRFERIRAWLSAFAGRELDVDEKVYQSEQETGHRNRAIAHLMRTTGALAGDVDEICSTYFRQCAVLVTCSDIAVMAATLARGGVNPLTGERLLAEEDTERVLAVMSTCGMYDNAGQWMLRVGLPAKSGVAGGICAVLPGQLGIGAFSPPLDPAGNSVRGVLACQELSRRFGLHLLHTSRLPAHPVRSTYRADVVTSKRIRPPRERALLRRLGSTTVVHELQGELGFAAAERVVRTVREQLAGARWIVLDLRRVTAIDASAVVLLQLLVAELAERRMTTLFADPHGIPAVAELERGDASTVRLRDCETALEWAEEAVLAKEDVCTLSPTARVPFGSQELLAELDREQVAVVRAATETRIYERGEVVFDEGDRADGIYFITRGMANVEVCAGRGGRWCRLNTVPAGSAFEELVLGCDGVGTSRVVAVEATECEVLSAEAFKRLRQHHPAISDAIFHAITRSLCARLRQATREIQTLEG